MLYLLVFVYALAYIPTFASFALAIPQNITERQTSSCECGYIITNRNNAYFRFRHVVDFSVLDSVDEVRELGWIVADGWQTGGENSITHQVPIGNPRNVYIVKGEGLALKVPRQDKTAKQLSAAEIQFPDAALGGIFSVTTKLTSIPGTCMGIFTSHADAGMDVPLGWHDEQDIEMLGASLLTTQTKPYYQPAGMQMIYYRPSDGAKSGSSQAFPTGVDPSKGYHTFSIDWYPATSDSNPSKPTEIRFDGAIVPKSPKIYSSLSPSTLVINQWSNADSRWSAGPPAQDAIMYVKKVVAYYDKPAKMETGTGVLKGSCDRSKACKVTV